MTRQTRTTAGRTVYFSALRLTAIYGVGEPLREALAKNFGVHAERGAILGWVQRDQLPGPVVAQMMLHNPSFPIRDLIAARTVPGAAKPRQAFSADPAPTAAGSAALEDLLS